MAKEPRSLAGKVVAITGGARGIGKATAQALVREGAKVAIGDLDLELAEQTAERARRRDDRARARRDQARVVRRATSPRSRSASGPVDVIINNAGIMPLGDFVDEDDATARRMVDINVHGVIFGMKLALPGMMRRNTGHIVNIASQAGKGGFPGGATYCATKHAVVGLCEAVRAELRDTAIEVSCVMPAVVNTELGSAWSRRAGSRSRARGGRRRDRRRAQDPKFDVWVPEARGLHRQGHDSSCRARGREGIARALKADKVLADADAERARRLRGPRRPLGAGPRARGGRGRGRRRVPALVGVGR